MPTNRVRKNQINRLRKSNKSEIIMTDKLRAIILYLHTGYFQCQLSVNHDLIISCRISCRLVSYWF